MEAKEFLILVDEKDQTWGKLEKELVHQLGLLHRAFSIFIFNSKGELLLQQRADNKYHSGGLWTNTCCSHPRFGEDLSDAVKRRLNEEMGMKSKTEFAFSFVYNTNFENGLTEHEFDHVFIGMTDDLPKPKELEVKNWKYMNIKLLENDLKQNPLHYTTWLRICFKKVVHHIQKKNQKRKKSNAVEYA